MVGHYFKLVTVLEGVVKFYTKFESNKKSFKKIKILNELSKLNTSQISSKFSSKMTEILLF